MWKGVKHRHAGASFMAEKQQSTQIIYYFKGFPISSLRGPVVHDL